MENWRAHFLINRDTIRPSVDYMKEIAEVLLEQPACKIKLQIPHTLVPARELVWLYSGDDGTLKLESDFEIKDFIDTVEASKKISSID